MKDQAPHVNGDSAVAGCLRSTPAQDYLPIPTGVALLALLDPEGWQSGQTPRKWSGRSQNTPCRQPLIPTD
jgi:hypothetical protein